MKCTNEPELSCDIQPLDRRSVNLFQISIMSLFALCATGELAEVRAALERGEDVNERERFNTTMLMYATLVEGKIPLLKLLLEQPTIEVNLAAAGQGFTALHMAVVDGKIEAMTVLLMDPRVDVNCKTSERETPLIFAAKEAERFDKLQLLLADERVDVNCAAVYPGIAGEFTALMVATAQYNLKAVKLLLDDERVDVNWFSSNDFTALHLPTAFKDVKNGILELFLSHPRVDVNCRRGSDGATVLHNAVHNSNVEAVRLILDEPRFTSHNTLEENEGTSALGLAAIKGHWEMLKDLVQHPKVDLALSGLGPDDLIR